ncbi:hypothetical protein HDV62DRAFT_346355 [Trichoderma sp. SZMC 28011]
MSTLSLFYYTSATAVLLCAVSLFHKTDSQAMYLLPSKRQIPSLEGKANSNTRNFETKGRVVRLLSSSQFQTRPKTPSLID